MMRCPPQAPLAYGSPPHAWGRLVAAEDGPRLLRFTPTCVGKTASYAAPSRNPSVHPHMRGEDSPQGTSFTPNTVHPHMRGEDPPRPAAPCASTVHPHMRGED